MLLVRQSCDRFTRSCPRRWRHCWPALASRCRSLRRSPARSWWGRRGRSSRATARAITAWTCSPNEEALPRDVRGKWAVWVAQWQRQTIRDDGTAQDAAGLVPTAAGVS